MLGRKLIIDRHCEMADLLVPAADQLVDDLATVDPTQPSIVVFGRDQYVKNPHVIHRLAGSESITPVFCDAAEGSETISWHIVKLGLEPWIKSHRMLMITGGDLPPQYPNMKFPLLPRRTVAANPLLQTQTILSASLSNAVKPYKFLFLNGRTRRNRKYLLERFQQWGLLDQSLWTCLEGWGFYDKLLTVPDSDENLMLQPRSIQYLPPQYELPAIRDRQQLALPSDTPFVKFHLFDGVWHDGEVWPKAYLDTYFSVITETVFEYPYSFITEKTAKPLCAGHPFVVSSNTNFYRDLKRMGFRTFGHLIDESFDSIDNCQDRIERIAQVVKDLCQQNLHSFQTAAADVCKYNQHRMYEFVQEQEHRFLHDFHVFVNQYVGRV